MPLAITMGLGAEAAPMLMPAIKNVNGNAITLHMKHKDNRDPSDNHLCCAFAATREFVEINTNTFAALFRAIVTSTLHGSKMENRPAVAAAIAGPIDLNQPLTVLDQMLLGRLADGLGNVRNAPNRINFDPFPCQSMAVWMLTQMKRWAYVKSFAIGKG